MNREQQATIGVLIVAAIAVWGFGLRATLRSKAHADQELTATATVAQVSTEAIAVTISRPVLTPTSPPAEAWATPSLTPALSPSPTETPTQQPTSSPSPTATPTQLSMPTRSSTPFATPIIPKVGRFLLVNQDEQVMHVYENGVEIRAIPTSTGKPVANAFTPAWRGNVGRYWGSGPFLNTNLWSDYMWYLFPGARGSILIHSVPYTRENNTKVYDQLDALGEEPASHGCVRISPEDAQWLQTWDPVGVPIEITPWSGEIGPPDDSL